MARPLRIQYPGAFYHITCRGNERRRIFYDDIDRHQFINQLKESIQIYQVIIYVYVLMENHFHLVLQTKRANLSEFMRHFNICYTGWFNYRHNTCGHLYQGRYKAFLVDADNYLLELSRYVHLNPVRIGSLRRFDHTEKWRYLKSYKWSSLGGYLDSRGREEFVEYSSVLEMVGGRGAYKQFLYDGLSRGVGNIFESIRHQMIMGDDDFVALIKEKYLKQGSLYEQPSYRSLVMKTINSDVVISCCAAVLGTGVGKIKERSGDGIVRGIVAEMLYRFSGINQQKIGELLGGIGYTGVSMLRKRLKKDLDNAEVSILYKKVEERLKQMCEE